ncbi:hypothetical protein LCGC14_2385940, partial [marine sediment metagenome]
MKELETCDITLMKSAGGNGRKGLWAQFVYWFMRFV